MRSLQQGLPVLCGISPFWVSPEPGPVEDHAPGLGALWGSRQSCSEPPVPLGRVSPARRGHSWNPLCHLERLWFREWCWDVHSEMWWEELGSPPGAALGVGRHQEQLFCATTIPKTPREGGRAPVLPGTHKLPRAKVGTPRLAARGEQLGRCLPEQNEKAITAASLLSCLLSATRRWQRGDRAPLSPLRSSRLRLPTGTSLRSGCSLTLAGSGRLCRAGDCFKSK